MKETTPQVRLIAEPRIRWGEIGDYLEEIGGMDWYDRMQPDGFVASGGEVEGLSNAEALVEYAGRRCYQSWVPGINPNVTKVREDSREYLRNILSVKHGSVLEHAQFTFDFANVSRVFTHELVRHRAGVAISQESLRYVRLTDLGFRVPEVLKPMRDQVVSIVERLEEFQRSAADAFGLDDEGVPFHVKKEVTSALRRLAPLGLSTGMVWSANIRTLRHVIEQRTAPGAEEEIRFVFDQVARIMRAECSALFEDFTPFNSEGVEVNPGSVAEPYHWRPLWEKV